MDQSYSVHKLSSDDGETIATETDTTVSNIAHPSDISSIAVENANHTGGWMQYETLNGDIYFYNHDTGESQWENPFGTQSHMTGFETSVKRDDEVKVMDLTVSIPTDHDFTKKILSNDYLMTPSRHKSSMVTSIIEVPSPVHSMIPITGSPASYPIEHFYEYHPSSSFKPTTSPMPSSIPLSSFNTPTSKHNSGAGLRIHTPIVHDKNIKRRMSFSSLSDLSDDLPSPEPPSFSQDQDLNSLSGSEFTDRHLRVWNKFFENALKTQVIPKLKKPYSDRVSNRKLITDKKINKESSFTSPNRTPRSIWPPPMKDSDYQELLEDFFNDSHHLYDKNWLSMIMMAAARKADAISISRVLSLDFDEEILKLTDEYLRSPAHYCAKNDDAVCLAVLYDSGVDCEAADLDGRAPIHVCSLFGSYDALKFLLESAVQVNLHDNNYNTALHLAARGGFVKLCRLLLEYEASPAMTNDQGQTAYMLTQTVNPRTEAIEEVLRLLIDISPTPKPSLLPMDNNHTGKKSSSRRRPAPSSSAISSSSSEDEKVVMSKRKAKQPVRFHVTSTMTSPDHDRLIRASYDYDEDITSQTSEHSRDRSSRAQQRLKEAMMLAKQDLHHQSSKTKPRQTSSATAATVAATPPPWFDLKVDTSMGKPSPDISASQKSILQSTSTPKRLPLPRLDSNSSLVDSHSVSSDADSYSEDDGTDARPGLMDKLSNAIWELTDTLLGITLSMFVEPKNSSNPKAKPSSDSLPSAHKESSNLIMHSLEDRAAPPTDKELSVLGLGFHAKPPAFVAAELNAGVEAIRTGRTPMRERPMQAPPEIEQLVNSMREEADHIASSKNVIDIQDLAVNPFLLTPKARQHTTTADSQKTESLPKPLFISTASLSSQNHSKEASTSIRSPIKNAYSVGNRLPDGVSWRYVDVMKNPEYMK
jgi:hypothetical protein